MNVFCASNSMIVFQSSNEFSIDALDESKQTVSTLLIPENMMPSFLFLVKNHGAGNISVYLRNLLVMYRIMTHSGMIPSPVTGSSIREISLLVVCLFTQDGYNGFVVSSRSS